MFVESLLESYAPQAGRRRWTTLASFLVQALGIGLLILLPLFYTEALPNLLRYGELTGPPPGEPPATAAQPETRRASEVASEMVGTTVLEPARVPAHVTMLTDEAPPAPNLGGFGVPGGTGVPGGSGSSLLPSILSTTLVPAPEPPRPTKPVRVSGGVMPGFLISQVKPTYPPLAKAARVQGDVMLTAVISRDGTIENLHVLSGHPMLVAAAIEAVRRWRYRPYLLNGQPVEVETQIVVNFRLAG
jgi:protein TonB